MKTATPRQVGQLERRDRRPAEVDLGVRLVGGQHEPVPARERGRTVVELQGSGRARGVVRVVEPEDRHAVPGRGVDGVEVGQEAALGAQRQLEHPLAEERRAALVDRVGGRGHGHQLALEHLGEVEDRLLGAHRRHDLRVRVQRRAEAAADPARHGRAQLGQAVAVRIERQRLDRPGQRRPDELRRLLARLAHAEVDERDLRVLEPPARLGQADERDTVVAASRRTAAGLIARTAPGPRRRAPGRRSARTRRGGAPARARPARS